jgi:hypothetical protein
VLWSSLLSTTLCIDARAAAPDFWAPVTTRPADDVQEQANAAPRRPEASPNSAEVPDFYAGAPRTEAQQRAVAARKRHALTFGATVGGIWGGVYASERQIGRDVGLSVKYENGHSEPVDLTLWSGGVFMAYDYGPEDLRLQATLLARFDTQNYSAGGDEYEVLSGSSIISSRYALLIGPALSLLTGTHGSLDAGLGVGGLVGYYRPAAALTDAVTDFAGDGAIQGPGENTISGVAARAWVSAMIWHPERKFGIGVALYYDMSWLHASLPPPWPKAWFDQSFGFMLPVSTRF